MQCNNCTYIVKSGCCVSMTSYTLQDVHPLLLSKNMSFSSSTALTVIWISNQANYFNHSQLLKHAAPVPSPPFKTICQTKNRNYRSAKPTGFSAKRSRQDETCYELKLSVLISWQEISLCPPIFNCIIQIQSKCMNMVELLLCIIELIFTSVKLCIVDFLRLPLPSRISYLCSCVLQHQQQVAQAVERAKQVTMTELNAIIGVRGLPNLPLTVCIPPLSSFIWPEGQGQNCVHRGKSAYRLFKHATLRTQASAEVLHVKDDLGKGNRFRRKTGARREYE